MRTGDAPTDANFASVDLITCMIFLGTPQSGDITEISCKRLVVCFSGIPYRGFPRNKPQADAWNSGMERE
jgi:hypothetical protein